MEWTDRGIVLAARKHGETSAIVELLTAERGRHLGLARGGAGRRQRGNLQPGNAVEAEWRARLADHLGSYRIEMRVAHAARLLDRPDQLAGLSAACAVASRVLPEREPHRAIHDGLGAVIAALEEETHDWTVWAAVYVRWEIELLRDLGFGLDLSACAVTGGDRDLAYVSPRTGRAVSTAGAGVYRDRLLTLPAFLVDGGDSGVTGSDIARGLRLSGFFLYRHLMEPHGRAMPPARDRFVGRLAKLWEKR